MKNVQMAISWNFYSLNRPNILMMEQLYVMLVDKKLIMNKVSSIAMIVEKIMIGRAKSSSIQKLS